MLKSELTKTKRQCRKVDLVDRYREIGIGAVAAAVRCQKENKPDDMSVSRQQKEKSSKRSTRGRVKCQAQFVMRTKDFRSLEEKRAYYRLLRHLLSERLQVSYKEDQARPLPSRMADVLKALEQKKAPQMWAGLNTSLR
jgi:hypothetical protein